jgi:hypothetical protein
MKMNNKFEMNFILPLAPLAVCSAAAAAVRYQYWLLLNDN